MKRLWPKSLAGQLILLLLLALVAAQAISAVFFLGERRHAIRAATHEQVLIRTASIVQLLNGTPEGFHDDILRGASSPRLRFSLDERGLAEPEELGRVGGPLRHELTEMLGPAAREVRVEMVERPWRLFADDRERRAFADWTGDEDDDEVEDDDEDENENDRGEVEDDDEPWWAQRHRHYEGHGRWHRRAYYGGIGLKISVLLPDDRWLNAATAIALPRPWGWRGLVYLSVMAVFLILIVVFTVRRLTRPLQRLAAAAEGFGRGEAVGDLPEAGPQEVRRTTRSFNLMRGRLERYIRDRMGMLAAVSHDLRTPITSLRLRAEFVEDEETKAKILQTLEDMQRMTEELLAFIREDSAREDSRQVDMAALLDSLCEDLRELGLDVRFAEAGKTPYACRPASLTRALRNLIENAGRYGTRARVTLSPAAGDPGGLIITIDDDGPGIPKADLERVFEPFVRLEDSRSQETGGIGLGLSIARSIVRGQGGEVTLENRPEGGLRVRVTLPGTPGG